MTMIHHNSRVITRMRGVIHGCVPVVTNAMSIRDIKWPEQDPYGFSVRAFTERIREEIQASRRQRGTDENQPGDFWVVS